MKDIDLKIRRQIGDGEMFIKLTIDEGEELLEYLDRSYDIEDDLRETNQVVISLQKEVETYRRLAAWPG
jgi:hypothetical protein